MTDHHSAQPSRRGATAAQIKGDIEAGLTGDKVGGHDPGAAPLGTDDEAGGEQFTPEELAATRAAEREGRPTTVAPNASTPDLQPNGRLGGQKTLVTGLIVGVGAALLLAALLLAVL